MRTRATLSLSGLLLAGFLYWPLAVSAQDASTRRPHHWQWEREIQAFEAMDKTNPPPSGAVLLIGSSSIRYWTNAPAQLPGYRLINRGFGGSHLSDSVAFFGRIVTPYRPKLVLLYAGDNDIAAGKPPEQVLADFKEFAAKAQAALPETTIAFISLKPSPSRTNFLAQMRTTNRLIAEFIETKPNLVYVDVFTPMLEADGQPRPELFGSDRLHLNAAGYQLWAERIRPVLERVTAHPAREAGGEKK